MKLVVHGLVRDTGRKPIQQSQSGIIMRSPNGQCWRGKVNDQGVLAFEQTTCPDGATSQPETIEPAQQLKVYPNPANTHLVIETTKITGSFLLTLIKLDGNNRRPAPLHVASRNKDRERADVTIDQAANHPI